VPIPVLTQKNWFCEKDGTREREEGSKEMMEPMLKPGNGRLVGKENGELIMGNSLNPSGKKLPCVLGGNTDTHWYPKG